MKGIYLGILAAAWMLLLVAVVGTALGTAVHRVGDVATAALAEPEPAGQAQTVRIGAIVGLVNKVTVGQTQTAAQPQPEPKPANDKWSLGNVALLACLIVAGDAAALLLMRPREVTS